jgi:hypothetical protein
MLRKHGLIILFAVEELIELAVLLMGEREWYLSIKPLGLAEDIISKHNLEAHLAWQRTSFPRIACGMVTCWHPTNIFYGCFSTNSY